MSAQTFTAEVTTQGTSAAPVIAPGASRAVQLAIRAQLMLQVTKLWPLLDPKHLDATWPAWVASMKLLTTDFQRQSSVAAGRIYLAARAAHNPSPAPATLVRFAPAPAESLLERAFGFSGPGMLSRDTARPNTALTTTLGTASRVALDGGRITTINTVETDPVAVGWYRVTDGRPCAFCALLASRGIVYRNEGSAGFQAHNDCGCTPEAAFTREHELPAVNRAALDVYRNRGKGPALPAFRKAWAEHLAQTV